MISFSNTFFSTKGLVIAREKPYGKPKSQILAFEERIKRQNYRYKNIYFFRRINLHPFSHSERQIAYTAAFDSRHLFHARTHADKKEHARRHYPRTF